MFSNDHLAEDEAIKAYNQGIVVCAEAKDYATRKLLQDILQDEDRHMDNIEEIQDEITQLGIQIFLSTQVK